MYDTNKIGDKIPPCFTPFDTLIGPEIDEPHLTLTYCYTLTKSNWTKSIRHRTKSISFFLLELFCTYKLNYIFYVLYIYFM